MQDEKTHTRKQFIHDYSIAIGASITLIVVLFVLLIAKYFAIASIQDLSKINPLITSGQNELIASEESGGVQLIAKNDSANDDSKENPGKTGNSSGTDSNSGSGGGTGGSGSSGGTGGDDSGGGGSGGTGGSGEPTQPQPFSANIFGKLSVVASGSGALLGVCKRTYLFTGDLVGQNPPGTVTYLWTRTDSSGQSEQVSFGPNQTEKSVTHTWVINGASRQYSIKLALLSPNTDEETLTFNHSCGIL